MRNGRLIVVGLGALLAAVLGWLVTTVALSFAAQPDVTENLSRVWTPQASTPLGASTGTEVPPGQTLVAFLVGTQLMGSAGTTTGDCSATVDGAPVDLSWPVHLDFSVDGVLEGDQQAVAIAGWTNTSNSAVTATVRCDTLDSTVAYYVAVPSTSAAIAQNPWFQPWAWLALGTAAIVVLIVGVATLRT